ncbi:MAG: hypothetical protein SAJ12_06320 [Jaaginema sp. PMC 1079.18]|nr:hypothetical protein [Jaaginema sp. PMC 1079.18]MEC4867716.1 hypothetical protein [Jaaginema sp. PMC 1078.18]
MKYTKDNPLPISLFATAIAIATSSPAWSQTQTAPNPEQPFPTELNFDTVELAQEPITWDANLTPDFPEADIDIPATDINVEVAQAENLLQGVQLLQGVLRQLLQGGNLSIDPETGLDQAIRLLRPVLERLIAGESINLGPGFSSELQELQGLALQVIEQRDDLSLPFRQGLDTLANLISGINLAQEGDVDSTVLREVRALQSLLRDVLDGDADNVGDELLSRAQGLQPILGALLAGGGINLDSELLSEISELQRLIDTVLARDDLGIPSEVTQSIGIVRRFVAGLLSDNELSLDPAIIESSPVLQQWRREVPDVLAEIRNDPAFRTRVRLGYSYYPSTNDSSGFVVGVEDILFGRSGFTASTSYDRVFDGDRQTFAADLQYYVLPLGSYINVAPVVGYRNITTDGYWTDGVAVGGKVIMPLSRTGAADITFSQMFVSPGGSNEVGITTLSVGYAFTSNLRLSTDIQKQNSIGEKDSRLGIVLEWMP